MLPQQPNSFFQIQQRVRRDQTACISTRQRVTPGRPEGRGLYLGPVSTHHLPPSPPPRLQQLLWMHAGHVLSSLTSATAGLPLSPPPHPRPTLYCNIISSSSSCRRLQVSCSIIRISSCRSCKNSNSWPEKQHKSCESDKRAFYLCELSYRKIFWDC